MAIKVGGTSVIDDSLNLQNIASIDATTEAAFTAAGFSQTTGDITAVTAGSGLTGGGTDGDVTLNHADTSSQASVNNSGTTVVQDITLDTYGHITNINSTTISTGASTTFGGVKTYMFASSNSGTTIASGSTVAGSTLRPTSAIGASNTSYTPAGTWRLMGHKAGSRTNWTGETEASLWVRIS